MASRWDVIIAGLGAMGSAAAWRLARQGRRVLAFDRYSPPHSLGSTHGRTRITREAYFEHPSYVPFIRRAYQLWDETARAADERLFLKTRGLLIGLPDGDVVSGALASAREHGIEHDVLSAREVRESFAVLRPADAMVAVLEHRAGILFPEACITAQLRLAAAEGAELRLNEPVTDWSPDIHGVQVTTASGRYAADRLVLAAGPWMPELLQGYGVPLQGERQSMYWFDPVSPSGFDPAECPIAVWDDPDGLVFATFPDLGDGVKIAVHHGGERADPDTLDRRLHEEDERAVRDRLERFIPTANGTLREAVVCIYTNTPDQHFVLDYLDESRRVIVASPCSGHGFKFASAVGEVIACLATDRPPPVDLSLFSLSRFSVRRGGVALP